MSKVFRWGLLGTGQMATEFARALNLVDDAELVAVASRSQSNADAFADKFSVPLRYSSYSALTENPEIDVVHIATPPSEHMQNSLLCLQADKAVLCEKPFALNAAQAKTVIDVARQKNLFLMEAMWTRFVPSIVKLRELLAADAIGNIQIMLAGGAYMPEFDPEYYMFRPDLGGGILMDSGIYLVSMASLVFGQASQVLATAELGKTGVDEHEAIILKHPSGALANLYVSHRAQSGPDMTLLGSKGKIHLHAPIFCPPALTITLNGDEQTQDFSFEGNGYQFEIEEVHQCLRAGKTQSSIMPLDETLSIMQTVDRIKQQI